MNYENKFFSSWFCWKMLQIINSTYSKDAIWFENTVWIFCCCTHSNHISILNEYASNLYCMPINWILLVNRFLLERFNSRFGPFENWQSFKAKQPSGAEETFLSCYQTAFRCKTVKCIEFELLLSTEVILALVVSLSNPDSSRNSTKSMKS